MITTCDIPEQPLIRPPNEWRSLLIRVTRGCNWNRCRFCGIYPHLGEPDFSKRSVSEVKHDIDLLHHLRPQAKTVFLGDADPLQVGVENFCKISGHLRKVFSIKRLTCYARSSTLHELGQESINILAKTGLNRVHVGLESGDMKTLRFHRKGQSPDMIRKTAAWLKEASIEVSFYVLLGLGGRANWEKHIRETARLVNETEPEFVRIRRLWLYGSEPPFSGPGNPLLKDIRSGDFIPQTPEGNVLELKFFLEQLDNLVTFVTCDHENNYVRVSGIVKENKGDMLAEIDSFLALSRAEREAHYQAVGSRI